MIVVDIEATGINPKEHSIVSIGALDFFNPKNQYYRECRIWEGAEIMPDSLEINGFSEAEVKDPRKKSMEETIREFMRWVDNITDKMIAGGNPSFDRDFLTMSAERYGIDWHLGFRTIDLHTLCYAHYLKRGLPLPIKNGKLHLSVNRILNYIGLPDEPKPHNALVGAKMEAEAFSRLIYGKPLLEEFNDLPVPDYL